MIDKIFPQDEVWAAAVAAQRINGVYVKRVNHLYTRNASFISFDNPKNIVSENDSKPTNVSLIRAFLNSDKSNLTLEDFENGQKIREYFCTLISLIFSGEAREYIKMAVAAAALQTISLTGKELPLIASMPEAYQKNMEREKVRSFLSVMQANSVSIPNCSSASPSSFIFTVVDCKFNKKFCHTPWAINAIVSNKDGSNSLVYFFDFKEWKVGQTYSASAYVKRINEQITQLEYVALESKINDKK